MSKARTFIGELKEEFFNSTETLWENEVRANSFVARILLYTAVIAAIIVLLSVFHVFSISSAALTGIKEQEDQYEILKVHGHPNCSVTIRKIAAVRP